MIRVSDAATKKFKEVAEKQKNPDDVKIRIYLGRAG